MKLSERIYTQKRRVKKLKKLNQILVFNLVIQNLKQASRVQTRINNLSNII